MRWRRAGNSPRGVQQDLTVLAMSMIGGMIVRALITQLSGVGRAPEAPVPRREPAEIGDELFIAHGGSVRAALSRLNAMGLSQEDAAQVVARSSSEADVRSARPFACRTATSC